MLYLGGRFYSHRASAFALETLTTAPCEFQNARPHMKIFRLLLLVSIAVPLFAQDYDVLIKNGRVMDGSGNPWVWADVGIKGDKIIVVGPSAANATAKRTIDATGLI